jgi:hypothetical protein
MNTLTKSSLAATLAALSAGFSLAIADDDRNDGRQKHQFATTLSSFNEVIFSAGPPAALLGALSTPGKGIFKARIDEPARMIHYELSYEGLEGVVTQGHIHIGQRHTVGGIVVWLCQASARAPEAVAALTPECPPAGTVTGTIRPSQVLAIAGQGIAGEIEERFDELVRAIRAGATYANVHTMPWPAGEIRGQIGDRDDDDHGHRR